MNKKLKIATVAVSVAMAGTMAFGMFGCKGKGGSKDVTLNINIGDAANRSISFSYGELLSGSVKLPDGKTYSSSSLKPAWAAFETMVGCKFKDVWQNTSKKIENAVNSTVEGSKLSDMDIITDGAANVSKYSDRLLDLSQYLDKMPNYKKFLDENPIVRLSLTSNTTSGAMYYAPYFDGNNDIEKYELFKINWVESLLDGTAAGDTTTTYASHGAVKKANAGDYKDTLTTATAIESFMGKTGSWNTDVLDKDGKKLDGGITLNYTKAQAAAADDTKPLGAAYKDAVGSAYTGTSGNIVDIMNAAINAKAGEINGAQLRKILQEYIKVAYYVGTTDTAFYAQEGYKLSDVFCGYSAAWDVDLYAALGRVLVTNPTLLKSGTKGNTVGGEGATELKNVYLLSARQNNMQRMIDTVSMVGQLYGVRGLESKNLYSYIDSEGNVADPRGDVKSYEAMEKFNAFWQEGLVYTGASGSNADQSYAKDKTPEALSCYDYVNTQTPAGFQLEEIISGKYTIEAGYNYAPIITPVSKWNDGAEKVMRFTESWRTTKDTGFCVPKANVEGNQKKLDAVLKFIDCMFSNDGQILLTYGPKASSATAGDGYWYNAEATDAQITAGTYFEYEGKKLYSEVEYSGVYQPTICENVYQAYYGKQTKEGVIFDGKSGITYAGEQMTVPEESAKVKKDAKFETDVYEVKSNGTYGKVAKDTKAGGDVYVVDGTDGNKYLVNKDGWTVDKNGKKLPAVKSGVSQWTTDSTLNYTNFARYVIGSALPIGNKLQSFEFQLTSKMGRDGALMVDKAMKAGVVKHTENTMTTNPWYTVVPTVLPYSKADTTALSGPHTRLYTGDEGSYFSNNKNVSTNLYWQIIKYGMNGTKLAEFTPVAGLSLSSGAVTAQDIIGKLETVDGYTAYLNIKKAAWTASKTYYNTIKAN